MAHRKVGVDCDEGPPVPIPNTEVKLVCAEDTWREAAWENKQMPTFFALIAQSVEHAAVNRSVTGSSPVWGARKNSCSKEQEFFQLYSPFGELYCSAVIFGLRPSDIRFASFKGRI